MEGDYDENTDASQSHGETLTEEKKTDLCPDLAVVHVHHQYVVSQLRPLDILTQRTPPWKDGRQGSCAEQ